MGVTCWQRSTSCCWSLSSWLKEPSPRSRSMTWPRAHRGDGHLRRIYGLPRLWTVLDTWYPRMTGALPELRGADGVARNSTYLRFSVLPHALPPQRVPRGRVRADDRPADPAEGPSGAERP